MTIREMLIFYLKQSQINIGKAMNITSIVKTQIESLQDLDEVK
jgi:hypothetical protein